MSKSTGFVTIGRNICGVPMPSHEWEAFQQLTGYILRDAGASIIQRPRIGSTSHVGMEAESAACFVFHIADSHSQVARPRLLQLAVEFEQDAIGYVVVPGVTHLIGPGYTDAPLYGDTVPGTDFVVGG